MKQAALRHQARIWRSLIASFVGAVAVGLGAWFCQLPANRDDADLGWAIGLAGSTFAVGCLLGRLLCPRPAALCPQCGCDWNVESDNDWEKWFAWKCCPGCGLRMNGE